MAGLWWVRYGVWGKGERGAGVRAPTAVGHAVVGNLMNLWESALSELHVLTHSMARSPITSPTPASHACPARRRIVV